ncbi:MFS transporter [Paraburkholderia sp.]|uniref:MFS transporter n=1 Tax=Paraburkholderia sp. TaxID=1926495 RepID=UPI003C7D1762
MNTIDPSRTPASLKDVRVTQIFIAAFITQFCIGLEVLLRINAATPIKTIFFDAVDPLTSGAHIGEILGVLFLGFAIANFVMAPFVDAVGMRRLHVLGVFGFLAGTATICLAQPGAPYAYSLLWAGSLLQGLAWGALESVLNPLVVSIYPTRKVARLNLFHAAYALGMLVAAPVCVLVAHYSLGWKLQLCVVFVPACVALLVVARLSYPPSERVAQGISFRDMFRHTLNRPLFYFCLCTMFLTAATELVTSSWIDLTLTKIVGIQGFWLVAFIYTVHLVVKSCAGVLNQYLGSAGLLMLASLFAVAGLLLLSQANTPASGLCAALVFGIGTAVMWPTTLAATSERFPAGGAFAIGTMASAGMLSMYVMMPVFGRMFDAAKIEAAGGAAAFQHLAPGTPGFDKTMVLAASTIFRDGSVMPVVTLVFFACLWFYDSRRRQADLALVDPVTMK